MYKIISLKIKNALLECNISCFLHCESAFFDVAFEIRKNIYSSEMF